MPVDAETVCAAFGLPERGATLVPHVYASSRTWRLTAGGDRFLVKQVPADRPAELAAAMAFEREAAAAGVAVPRQVPPARPAVGCAARLPDGTLVRVSEWVDGRPVGPRDNLAGWLGATLARLHALRPLTAAEPAPRGWARHPHGPHTGRLRGSRRAPAAPGGPLRPPGRPAAQPAERTDHADPRPAGSGAVRDRRTGPHGHGPAAGFARLRG